MIYHYPLRKRRSLRYILSICVIVLMFCSISTSVFAEGAESSAADEVGQQPVPSVTNDSDPVDESEPGQADARQEGDVSTLAVSGPKEVRVGEQITLSGSGYSNHRWSVTSGDGQVALSSADSREVTVTGQKEGSVTLRHTYGRGWNQGTETYAIQVTANDGTYPLYIYTLIPGVQEGDYPDLDKVWNGMGVGSVSGVNAPSSYPIGTIVDNGYGQNGVSIDYNEAQFPAITVDGKSYQYAQTDEQKHQEGYYTVSWIRLNASDGANAGGNNKNPVVSSGIMTFHLDGVVTLNERDRYTVNFALKDAGQETFSIVDPEVYSKRVDAGFAASRLKRPDTNEPQKYPQTKVADGRTYTLDGWYKDEACTIKVDWGSETIDRNTTFYAKYVTAGKPIKVTKEVTGGLGDIEKAFTFTYSYADASGAPQSGQFSLKDDGTYTIPDVPVGAVLTLQETNAGGYATYAQYGATGAAAAEDKASDVKTMQITVDAEHDLVVVTNSKDYTPDTGADLQSTPYILLSALVIVGAAALIARRYKRRDV
ncbi:MAG: DUF5979 domain-containing protein [Clostridia bacterium]